MVSFSALTLIDEILTHNAKFFSRRWFLSLNYSCSSSEVRTSVNAAVSAYRFQSKN